MFRVSAAVHYNSANLPFSSEKSRSVLTQAFSALTPSIPCFSKIANLQVFEIKVQMKRLHIGDIELKTSTQ